MMKKIFFLAIFFNSLASAYAQQVIMIGPMLHLNIGDNKHPVSFAIEASYWNYKKFPYSVDLAIEFERDKLRLYTEAQTGVGLAGISAGPVFEFDKVDGGWKAGFQGSVWGNYFLGFDLRYRAIGGNSFLCPGVYGKLPISNFKEGDGDNDDHDFDWD